MKLSKTYEAAIYENDINALWEKHQSFLANPHSHKEHYSICMPPPNETGNLHIGHALFITLEDILARQARQKGKDVLWLPGTDHAALPVNALVEKQLALEGTNKHQIGRNQFIKRTEEFVNNNKSTITKQVRAMGASVDWTRFRHTLDPALSRCVNEVFIKMFNDGLIYRGKRIVNWDPELETNVSDDEVEYIEEKGKLYTLQYGPFQITTARPETKFGDKYVVMHPDDKRYKKYKHLQTFEAEWINGKVTATIIKDSAIDPNFGTGVMTITPSHSQVDFDIAQRHNLDYEQIIDFHGNLLPIAGEFAGIDIKTARPLIVQKLDNKGLLINVDTNYHHSVAVNSRGKAIIEPQIRLQWFIDVNKEVVEWKGKRLSLKQVMQAVINDQDIKLIPKRFEKIYFHWIDNLRDWCISRQIWWGHRIPVWYRIDADGKEETRASIQPPTDQSEGWHQWEQDPDTLDTWFSSALWTWSTLIDPTLAQDYSLSLNDILKQSIDYQAYHPVTVLETGWDILFFWVARMILATTYATGSIPFKNVYLHGLVRTENGQKMSKSHPETIIDPLQIIPEYGTDALRLALIQGMSAGQDQRLGKTKIIANRNFCNKVWNIARYIEDVVGDPSSIKTVVLEQIADHWIIQKLQQCQEEINLAIDQYRFSDAYESLYHFIWDNLADWYIEAAKSQPNKSILSYVLTSTLIMAHPFMPFITETIWQTLAWEGESVLAEMTQPKLIKFDKQQADDFNELKNIVSEARYIIKALKATDITLYYSDVPFLQKNSNTIKRLAKLKAVTEVRDGIGLNLHSTKFNCWLDIDSDTAQDYLLELKWQIQDQQNLIERLQNRLNNSAYLTSAPKNIIEDSQQQLNKAQELKLRLEKEQARFNF